MLANDRKVLQAIHRQIPYGGYRVAPLHGRQVRDGPTVVVRGCVRLCASAWIQA